MADMIERIVNVTSGAITEQPYTPAQEADAQAAAAEHADRVTALEAAAQARDAALAKLTALGLTADDLKALGL